MYCIPQSLPVRIEIPIEILHLPSNFVQGSQDHSCNSIVIDNRIDWYGRVDGMLKWVVGFVVRRRVGAIFQLFFFHHRLLIDTKGKRESISYLTRINDSKRFSFLHPCC